MFGVTLDPKHKANCEEKLKILDREAALRGRAQLGHHHVAETVDSSATSQHF
jgi:hypothetical protein